MKGYSQIYVLCDSLDDKEVSSWILASSVVTPGPVCICLLCKGLRTWAWFRWPLVTSQWLIFQKLGFTTDTVEHTSHNVSYANNGCGLDSFFSHKKLADLQCTKEWIELMIKILHLNPWANVRLQITCLLSPLHFDNDVLLLISENFGGWEWGDICSVSCICHAFHGYRLMTFYEKGLYNWWPCLNVFAWHFPTQSTCS